MKTIMNKTAIAAALVVVAILMATVAVLSCNSEVEITERDWKAVNEGKDTSILSIGTGTDYVPSITASLNVNSSVTNYNIVTVTFSEEADVLQKKNTEIAGAMQKFLKFYTYTRGYDSTTADTLGQVIGYSFDSRIKGTIKIKLDSVPYSNVVWYLSASDYTYANGKKLGGKGDTKYGIAYYDRYGTLGVTNTGSTTTQAPFFKPYNQDWELSIVKDLSNVAPTIISPSVTIPVASLNLGTNLNGISIDTQNSWRSSILNGWTNKFKLRQFSVKDGKWSDAQGTFNYQGNSLISNYGNITLTFTPEDLVPYVVEVSGLDNLEVGPYWGVNQRVKVSGGIRVPNNVKGIDGDNAIPAFNVKKLTTNPYQWVNTRSERNRKQVTGSDSVVTSGELITTDKEDKNLIVKLHFAPITPPGDASVSVYLSRMELADFKKYFKIGYLIDGSDITNTSLETGKIAFLDIKKIEYSSDIITGAYASRFNKITLTLNADYSQASYKDLHIFIAEGFTYGTNDTPDSRIVFGNYGNWEFTIDGVRYFDYYGKLTGISGDFVQKAVAVPTNE